MLISKFLFPCLSLQSETFFRVMFPKIKKLMKVDDSGQKYACVAPFLSQKKENLEPVFPFFCDWNIYYCHTSLVHCFFFVLSPLLSHLFCSVFCIDFHLRCLHFSVPHQQSSCIIIHPDAEWPYVYLIIFFPPDLQLKAAREADITICLSCFCVWAAVSEKIMGVTSRKNWRKCTLKYFCCILSPFLPQHVWKVSEVVFLVWLWIWRGKKGPGCFGGRCWHQKLETTSWDLNA